MAEDHDSFARLVRDTVRALPGVKVIHTSFILKEIKTRGALPLLPTVGAKNPKGSMKRVAVAGTVYQRAPGLGRGRMRSSFTAFSEKLE